MEPMIISFRRPSVSMTVMASMVKIRFVTPTITHCRARRLDPRLPS